jgi:hypothetical protein
LEYFQQWLLDNGLVSNGAVAVVEAQAEAEAEAEAEVVHSFLLLDQLQGQYLQDQMELQRLVELVVVDLLTQEVLIMVEFLIQEF